MGRRGPSEAAIVSSLGSLAADFSSKCYNNGSAQKALCLFDQSVLPIIKSTVCLTVDHMVSSTVCMEESHGST